MPVRLACDTHVHVFTPQTFPYAADRGYTPGSATADALAAFMATLGTKRTVIVQPSVYGIDNRCTLAALEQLGPTIARGVAVIDPDRISNHELSTMDRAGIRGVRLNLNIPGVPIGQSAIDLVRATAAKVASLGWVVQIFAPIAFLGGISTVLAALPTPVILDHFAGAQATGGVGQTGLAEVIGLIQSGRAYAKLSALHRVSDQQPDYADLGPIARLLVDANPERVIWGSDWPHPMHVDSVNREAPGYVDPFHMVDDRKDVLALTQWISEPATQTALFAANAERLFRF